MASGFIDQGGSERGVASKREGAAAHVGVGERKNGYASLYGDRVKQGSQGLCISPRNDFTAWLAKRTAKRAKEVME